MRQALRLALAVTMILAARAVAAEAFDFSAYVPATLRHVAVAQGKAFRVAERQAGLAERVAVLGGTRYRILATWTGAECPLSHAARGMIERWARAFRRPDVPGLFEREIIVRHAGRMRRLPIQSSLLPHLRAESGPGGKLVLFVTLLGTVNGDMIFVVNEFRPR